MKTKLVFVLVLMSFLFGCKEENDKTSGTGIVVHMKIEVGFYGIITDGGDHYKPDNLSSEFQKDSLRISFEGIITDQPTTVMWGRTITITKIERIP